MMAFGRVNKATIDEYYREISEHEARTGLGGEISSYLTLLFEISQSEETTSTADFLSGRNLPIAESFEDLNTSYELIKMGFNKQSFISLRVGLDNGLVAAYWKGIGDGTREFRGWLSSKEPTPRKSKPFWQAIRSLPAVAEFFEQFTLESDVKKLDELSDYIHTRGSAYASFTDFQKRVQSGNKYVFLDKWWSLFRAVTRVVVILQLLVNPKLAIAIPDDLLLRKFGTYARIPFMGVLVGDHTDQIRTVVGDKEYSAIFASANETSAVKSLLADLDALPDLGEDELRRLIFEEQKRHILDAGFGLWFKNRESYDHRIDQETTERLRIWLESQKAS
jgi:hypothetical protein